MTALWTAKLPFPPSANGYYENRLGKVKKGASAGKIYTGRMISAEGQAFRQEVFAIARRGHVAPVALRGRLDLLVLLVPPDEKADGSKNRNRRDLDNHFKPLQDALTRAGVIADDSLFDRIEMVRGNPIARGAAYVRISRFDPASTERAIADLGVVESANQRFPF